MGPVSLRLDSLEDFEPYIIWVTLHLTKLLNGVQGWNAVNSGLFMRSYSLCFCPDFVSFSPIVTFMALTLWNSF